MKLKMKRCLILSAFLMMSVLLTACSSLVSIKYENGQYIDNANGVVYNAAGVSYEPVSVGKEYARYKKTVYYEINGLEPTKWLTENFSGIGSILYSTEIELPGFTEFEPVSVHVCDVDEITAHLYTITDGDDINIIVEMMRTAEEEVLPPDGRSYHLKFTSEKYPSIYYNLIYVVGSNGINYIYDRDTKRCVNAGDVIQKYFAKDVAQDEA